MHNLYILAQKDPARTWAKLPFIVVDDAIFKVMAAWSLELRALDLVELEKTTTQQWKKEAKLCITKLEEKKHQEEEAVVQWKAAETTTTTWMAKTTTASTKEIEEGQEMSMKQDIQGEVETQ